MIDDNGPTTKIQNLVSLKEHIESKIKALEDKIQLTFELNRIAVDKAEAKMDERLSGMNEFREALKDQSVQFFTKREFEALHNKLLDDVCLIRNQVATHITRAEADLIHSRIEDDTQRILQAQARSEGKASMVAVYWAYGIALIGIIISLIDIISK